MSSLCGALSDYLLIILSGTDHHLIRVQLIAVCPHAVGSLLPSYQPGIDYGVIAAALLEQRAVSIQGLVIVERAVLQIQPPSTDALGYGRVKQGTVDDLVDLIGQHIEVSWHIYLL